ncbi:MAG TPA: magnesium transporter CorA family protein [Mesorhizobium sp.]|nr:magnesium transporter CorA family protein [Mesorhizobium sp.]
MASLGAAADCRGLSRADVVWFDLFDPTPEEERAVEHLLGVAVPTRQEMAEIEESARLYTEAGALVMTAVVAQGVTEGRPRRAQVTFVLNAGHLVTVRYADPLPFRNFAAKCARQPERHRTAAAVLVSLLETIVERAADVLEGVAAELNEIAATLFLDDRERGPAKAETVLRSIVRRLGRKNVTLAILRESLLSLSRLVPFLRQGAGGFLPDDDAVRLKAIDRDIRSLSAYEAQTEAQITYLHDATLGLINLDQNRIIKVFSIAAVLFLPPTLVGTVYGMNFEFMPELNWLFGYPFALLLMVVSALIPLWWFKRRGWL